MPIELISPENAHDLITKHPETQAIDVRTPAEYAAIHIDNFTAKPLSTIDRNSFADEEATIVLLCRSGARAQKAADMIDSENRSIKIVEGGLMAWEAAGLPVVRGKSSALPLERQTQIAIGSLLLIFVSLGWFVHPAFFALIVGMGCGLIFAGVSGTCALGLFIAKMPWNRAPKS